MTLADLDTETKRHEGFVSSSSFLAPLAQSVGLALFATACGALGSQALGSASSGLGLMLVLVLAGALAVVWHIVARVPWATPAATWRAWTHGEPLPSLPYAQRDSDAAHLSANLGYFRAWVTQMFAPRYLGIAFVGLSAALVAVALSAALAASAGAQVVVLAIVALVAAQVGALLCTGVGRPPALLQGLVLVATMFTLGYSAFAPPSLLVVCIAIAFGAVAAAATSIEHNRALQWAGYGLGLAIMIVARQTFGAFALSVLWLPQVLLPGTRSPRVQMGWFLVGMVAASLALSL